MRRNPDCIRDILLTVEENTDICTDFEYTVNCRAYERLDKYSYDEIVYHVRQCCLSDYFFRCDMRGNGALIIIEDLSPAGHEFLANTRKNAVWEKAKAIGDEVGCNTVKGLAEICVGLIQQAIKGKIPII